MPSRSLWHHCNGYVWCWSFQKAACDWEISYDFGDLLKINFSRIKGMCIHWQNWVIIGLDSGLVPLEVFDAKLISYLIETSLNRSHRIIPHKNAVKKCISLLQKMLSNLSSQESLPFRIWFSKGWVNHMLFHTELENDGEMSNNISTLWSPRWLRSLVH